MGLSGRDRRCRSWRDLGTPLLIHQPSYSMLNRWIEEELLAVLEEEGVRSDRLLAARTGAAHRPLLDGVPRLAREQRQLFLARLLSEENLAVCGLSTRSPASVARRSPTRNRGRYGRASSLRTARASGSSSSAERSRRWTLDFAADELAEIDPLMPQAGSGPPVGVLERG